MRIKLVGELLYRECSSEIFAKQQRAYAIYMEMFKKEQDLTTNPELLELVKELWPLFKHNSLAKWVACKKSTI